MFFRERKVLCSILDESPFFTELSVIERMALVKELLESYPQLQQHAGNDTEVDHEISCLRRLINIL